MNLAYQSDMFPDRRELERAVNVLTARFVWFYPKLTHALENPKTALMLCHLLHAARFEAVDGWVNKSRDQWTQETGLGRREQESARQELRDLGYLNESHMGTPRRLCLQPELSAIGAAMAASAGLGNVFRGWDWNNSALMLQLLGKPFGFYQPAAMVCGSAQSAIYLSFLIFLQRGAMSNAAHTPQWFTLPADRAQALLGLSYRMQRTARQKLQDAGLIDQRPAPTMERETQFRVRFSALMDLLGHKQDPAHQQSRSTDGLPVDNSASVDNSGNNEYFCLREPNFGAHKTTKTPCTKRQKRPTQNDINALHKTTETPNKQGVFVTPYIKTKEKYNNNQSNLTETPRTTGHPGGGSGDNDKNALVNQTALDLSDLSAVWHDAVRQSLQGVSVVLAQTIADEFTGRMTVVGMDPLRFPLRYLDKLVQTAQLGTFRPELGVAIAQKRNNVAQRERLFAEVGNTTHGKKTEASSHTNDAASDDTVKRAALAKLAKLRSTFGRGGVEVPHPPLRPSEQIEQPVSLSNTNQAVVDVATLRSTTGRGGVEVPHPPLRPSEQIEQPVSLSNTNQAVVDVSWLSVRAAPKSVRAAFPKNH